MRALRLQALVLFALLTLPGAEARAQLSQFPIEARTGESIRLSGLFESACFTGHVWTEIDGTAIRLLFEEACDPGPPSNPIEHTFDRYLPPLAAGTYSVALFRHVVTAGTVVLEPVGSSHNLTVRQGRFLLRTDPASPVEGQEVFLEIASECVHDGFELVPGPARPWRVIWFPIPILPPPCGDTPNHVTSFSLGQPPVGESTVLLVSDGVENGPLLDVLTFQVLRADTPVLDLQNGRFRVTVIWGAAGAAGGTAHAVPLTSDSGAYWFFRPDNLELLVKVLDGCAVNGHYWVLGAGLTDVGVSVEIQDTFSGAIWTHDNPLGVPFAPVQDTGAFDCP